MVKPHVARDPVRIKVDPKPGPSSFRVQYQTFDTQHEPSHGNRHSPSPHTDTSTEDTTTDPLSSLASTVITAMTTEASTAAQCVVKVAPPVGFSKDFVIGLVLAISSSFFIGTRSEFTAVELSDHWDHETSFNAAVLIDAQFWHKCNGSSIEYTGKMLFPCPIVSLSRRRVFFEWLGVLPPGPAVGATPI